MRLAFLLALTAAPALADPDALGRHFSGDFNCYALADPVPGLVIDLRHDFNARRDHLGANGKYYYDIELVAGDPHNPIWVTGQCHTEGGDIDCGVGCDSGQFRLMDAGIESILLRIERLGEECPDGGTRTLDLDRIGRLFMLRRIPDSTCESYFSD